MLRHLLRECVSRAPMTTPRALAPWTACVAGCAAARASPSARMRPWMGTAQIRPWVGTASRAASTSPVTAASPSSRYGARRGRGRVALLRPRAATTTGPNPSTTSPSSDDDEASRGWTLLGCDSDAGGALAVVRGPSIGDVASVDVHDCPTYKAEVNGRARKRLCVEDMVELVASLDIPRGTVAFVEEGGVEYGFSAQTAFVQGYNFGLWKGVLAAAGLRVEVVKPQAWKHALGLARSGSSKDDSRDMASGDVPGGWRQPGTQEGPRPRGGAAHRRVRSHGDAREGRADKGGVGGRSGTIRGSGRGGSAVPAGPRHGDASRRGSRFLGDERHSYDDDETTRSGLRKRLGPDDPLPYFGPYFGMTGKALGEECRRRGLRVSGKKMELIERLEEDDAAAMRRAREAAAVMEAKGDEEEERKKRKRRGGREGRRRRSAGIGVHQ